MKRLIFVLLLIIGISFVFAVDVPREVQLVEGKNIVNATEFEPLYIKTLVKMYPEIESASYDVGGVSYGYVNVFGGIGTDFVVMPGIDYEIVVSNNITINLR